MVRRMAAPAALVALTLLSGCAEPGGSVFGGGKQTVGTIGGAVAGGLVGSQFGSGTGQLIMTGLGALAGAFVGGEIGRSLDRADQQYAYQAGQQAFNAYPPGQPASWRNPSSGHYGYITPTTNPYPGYNGEICREYEHTVYIDGQPQTMRGTACRNPDGTWSQV